MTIQTRKLVDRAFSTICLLSVLFMAVTLVIFLGPILEKGFGAYVFRGTVDYREMMLDLFERGSPQALSREVNTTREARQPLYQAMLAFEDELSAMKGRRKRELRRNYREFRDNIAMLLGPLPEEFGEKMPISKRFRFGATRWDLVLKFREKVVTETYYDYSGEGMGVLKTRPLKLQFAGTALEPVFDNYLSLAYCEKMFNPEWTFYWRYLFDESHDSHIFGGIWPEVKGTLFLTIGTMLFAIPLGVISAIYLVEHARESWYINLIRTCISTLAGVPSIIFGLFGMAFFLDTIFDLNFFHNFLGIASTKSALTGSLTLALLVLPTIIRASEEAIRAVPHSYKEAAIGLGANRWRTVLTVILPAAMPGILTGIVISMGRAAGETAPIIFTAAVSEGTIISLDTFTKQATPALPWNIYNLAQEHEAPIYIEHMRYGMVTTLVLLVLALNFFAIYLRARISKNLRG